MKNDIAIPKPKRKQNGQYYAQLMISGKRFYVYGNTLAEYRKNVILAKTSKTITVDKKDKTLRELINSYIDSNSNVLSPSTIKGYDVISRCRFVSYIDKPIDKIDWQLMINEEATKYAPKSIKNAWGLIAKVLKVNDYTVPTVNLPMLVPNEMPFLDYEQITVFLKYAYGTSVELPALLALNSLRMSEIKGLQKGDIINNQINIKRSLVIGKKSVGYLKTTKTAASTRSIPIILPRINELIPDTKIIVPMSYQAIDRGINKICKEANLPLVACHGLRRSFSSLAYHLGWNERTTMLIGGWSNIQTVHKHYIKLAKTDVDNDIKSMQDYFKITYDSLNIQ